MKEVVHLLALPAALIALLSTLPLASCQKPWSYNLPAHERYFPEHEAHVRRDVEIQQRLATTPPTGVRKMSGDEGEKFFLDYWQLHDSTLLSPDEGVDILETDRTLPSTVSSGNSSLCGLLPPILLHIDKQSTFDFPFPRVFGRSLFERSFQCPGGTSNCASIGQPDICCASGATCISVQDTGSGPVGCCPSGQTCGGKVAGCDTAAGYTSCPGSANGGCCIPGYSCQGVGCIYIASSTTTTTLPLVTRTTAASSNVPPSSSPRTSASTPTTSISVQTITTTIISTPPASTGLTTVTQIIIITPSVSYSSSLSTTTIPPPSSATSGQGSQTCTTGYHSCPVSLGGGCCPNARSCAISNLCLPTTTPLSSSSSPTTSPISNGSPAPPVRPTYGSSSSTVVISGCPTGFYMCSAFYLGGCCRVGRNCDTTSCPPEASTAVVSTTGLTIIAGGSDATSVPVVTLTSTTTPGAGAGGGGASTTTNGAGNLSGGSCASGWFSCGAGDGGGCCPSGFLCGTSCTATISGQSNIGKDVPSEAFKKVVGWGMLVLGGASGILMVVL